MREVTATELQTLDPKRFDRECWEWREHALDYHWWESIEDGFKADCMALNIRVDGIQFDLSYSQSDNASFTGRVELAEFMEHTKLNEEYLALYLAVKDDGSYVLASTSHRGNRQISMECYPFQTAPSGVFSDLPQEAWEALIYEQEQAANLHDAVQEYIATLCRELYLKLRDEYEYATSDESFIEHCECNDVTFTLETEDEILTND